LSDTVEAGPVLGEARPEERAEYEAAEIRLRDDLDEDDALSAVQLLVAEGWRPPGAVAALVAAARAAAVADVLESEAVAVIVRAAEQRGAEAAVERAADLLGRSWVWADPMGRWSAAEADAARAQKATMIDLLRSGR
jgi:hypothetical protein